MLLPASSDGSDRSIAHDRPTRPSDAGPAKSMEGTAFIGILLPTLSNAICLLSCDENCGK
jgi:hypothetical protein